MLRVFVYLILAIIFVFVFFLMFVMRICHFDRKNLTVYAAVIEAYECLWRAWYYNN